jgi:hypothetical protein
MVNTTPEIMKSETLKGGSRAGQRIHAAIRKGVVEVLEKSLKRSISTFQLPGMAMSCRIRRGYEPLILALEWEVGVLGFGTLVFQIPGVREAKDFGILALQRPEMR